jgi:hypothetical protein
MKVNIPPSSNSAAKAKPGPPQAGSGFRIADLQPFPGPLGTRSSVDFMALYESLRHGPAQPPPPSQTLTSTLPPWRFSPELAKAPTPPGSAVPLPSLLGPVFLGNLGLAMRGAPPLSAVPALSFYPSPLGLDQSWRALFHAADTGASPHGFPAQEPFDPNAQAPASSPPSAPPPQQGALDQRWLTFLTAPGALLPTGSAVANASGSAVASPTKDLALLIGECQKETAPTFKALLVPGDSRRGQPLVGSLHLDPEEASKWGDVAGDGLELLQWEFPGSDARLDGLGMGVEGFALAVSGIGLYQAASKGDWKGLRKYGLSLTGNTIGLAGSCTGYHSLSILAQVKVFNQVLDLKSPLHRS